MVFGNKGDRSATGVGFTRDPSTGKAGLYGEFLTDAQGEDVVAGIRAPEPLERMQKSLPQAFEQLTDTMRLLEGHYREMQDIEFTVEDGRPLPPPDAEREADGRGRAPDPRST